MSVVPRMLPDPPAIVSRWNPLLAAIAVMWFAFGLFQAIVGGAK